MDEAAPRKLGTNIMKEAAQNRLADTRAQGGPRRPSDRLRLFDRGFSDDSSHDSPAQGEPPNLLATTANPDAFNPNRARKSFTGLQAGLAGKSPDWLAMVRLALPRPGS